MPELPDGLVNYTTLPTLDLCFTATTIPRGLQSNHSTKEGTWGVIRVLKGTLEYTLPDEVFKLTPDVPGVIEPTKLHFALGQAAIGGCGVCCRIL